MTLEFQYFRSRLDRSFNSKKQGGTLLGVKVLLSEDRMDTHGDYDFLFKVIKVIVLLGGVNYFQHGDEQAIKLLCLLGSKM